MCKIPSHCCLTFAERKNIFCAGYQQEKLQNAICFSSSMRCHHRVAAAPPASLTLAPLLFARVFQEAKLTPVITTLMNCNRSS